MSTDLQQIMSSSSVVFVGEDHCTLSHKNLAFSFLDHMGKSPQFDTFVFEMGEQGNEKILDEYLTDKSANPGTLKELYYICKLSGVNTKISSFEDFKKLGIQSPKDVPFTNDTSALDICGPSQRWLFRKPQLEMYRKMRGTKLSYPKSNLKFCGINYELREWPGNDFIKFNSLINRMPEILKKAYHLRFGNIDEQIFKENSDILLDAIRDYYMAYNVRTCTRGRQGALVQAGLFHTQDTGRKLAVCIQENLSSLNTPSSCCQKSPTPTKNCSTQTESSMYEAYKLLLAIENDKTRTINIGNMSFDSSLKNYEPNKDLLSFQRKFKAQYEQNKKIKYNEIPQNLKSYFEGSTYQGFLKNHLELLLTPGSDSNCDKE